MKTSTKLKRLNAKIDNNEYYFQQWNKTFAILNILYNNRMEICKIEYLQNNRVN